MECGANLRANNPRANNTDVTRAPEQFGIRSSARKPLLHAAIGLASMTIAADAVAQQQLPPIDVQGGQRARARAVSRPAAPAPVPEEAPAAAAASDSDAISPVNTLQGNFGGISRLPGRVQDIPQTITVINQQTLRQQGVTTLDQALRNVPGVTVNSGEGNGGQNGDQFRIRGFDARSDLYVDGLRDFGGYQRDAFSIEQIQVLKGPASQTFGYGTTGGAVNLQQKQARLGDFFDIEGVGGTGPLGRVVADMNKQIDKTSAIRLVGMYHNQDIVDRDHLYSDRWGFLGSVGLGLGTRTSFTFNYMHQNSDRKPDLGTPVVLPTAALIARGVVGQPLPEYGAPKSLFYGMNTDRDRADVDMFTAKFKHEFSDSLTLHNDTRVAYYDRVYAYTSTVCEPATAAGTACVNNVLGGNLNVPYVFSAGGGSGFRQKTQGAQNVTTLVAKFNTGFLRHEMVSGVDVNGQEDKRVNFANVGGAKVPGMVLNPNYINAGVPVENYLNQRKADSFNLGLFASDRMWLTEQFSLVGGVRWDRFDSTFDTTLIGNTVTGVWQPQLKSETEFTSPKFSAIWEPTKEQTYYVTWSRSYSNLAGQLIGQVNIAGIQNTTLQPEENTLWEGGLKWSLLNGKLGFTAALFEVTKGNSIQTDATGQVVQTNEKQRVRGVELGVTGKITDQWEIQGGYAYMDSEIISAQPAGVANIGHRVFFVPLNSATLWTTYDIAPLLGMQGKLKVGGGFVYTGGYYINSTNTAEVPGQTVVNLVTSYEYDKYRLSLNVYNLFDELAYDAAFTTGRAVVAAGRTVTLTAGVRW